MKPSRLLLPPLCLALIASACATGDGVTKANPKKPAPATAQATPKAAAPRAAAPKPAPVGYPLQMGAGRDHVCVLRDNAVRCWGAGSRGRLGDGTQQDRKEAVPVVGLPKGRIEQLAVSDAINCVRYDSGETWCWGDYNNPGRHGYKPAKVHGVPDDAVDVAVGKQHVCLLGKTGAVHCVGRNFMGQLAHPQMMFGGPGKVALPEPAKAIFGLELSTCATLASGKLACWGRDIIGLFGKLGAGCLTVPPRPNAVGCSTTPKIVDWVKGPVEGLYRSQDGVCVRTTSDDVSCLINRKVYTGVSRGVVKETLAGLTTRSLLCALGVDKKVRCATRKATTCEEYRPGKLRCRGTLYNPEGPDWEAAFMEVPGWTDAVALAATHRDLCVVRTAGAVECRTMGRWDQRKAPPEARVIPWKNQKALLASKEERKARLDGLRKKAAEDLFAGARWFLASSKIAHLRSRDEEVLAMRLLHAGRRDEGLAAAANVKTMGRYVIETARAGRCDVAAAVSQVPGRWLRNSIDQLLELCGGHFTPAAAKLLERRLVDAVNSSDGYDKRTILTALARFYATQGDSARGSQHLASAVALNRGRISTETMLEAIALGLGDVVKDTFDKKVNALPNQLSLAFKADPPRGLMTLSTRPNGQVGNALDAVRKMLPALGTYGRKKEAATLAREAFALARKMPMGELRRVKHLANLVTAGAKAGLSQGGLKKQLKGAAKMLAGARKKAAKLSKEQRRPDGKRIPGRFDILIERSLQAVTEGWVALGDLKAALKGTRGQTDRDKFAYSSKPFLAAKAFGAYFTLAESLASPHMGRTFWRPLLLEAAKAKDCKMVARVLDKQKLYELKADLVETVAYTCPKETAAASQKLDLNIALRRPGLAIIRASQGQWIPALQAISSVMESDRARTWAHVAALWQLAGSPKPEGLREVLDAILSE